MRSVTKNILISSLIAILAISVFAYFSLKRFHETEVTEENEKLETCIRTFGEFLRNKGENLSVVDGRLLAGSYLVNGNFELPDKVQEIFGGVATVFLGDTRVSTNVLNADGRRAVGTKLVGPAYDAIFKQGDSYRGEVAILGIPYLTAYDPLKDSTGRIIGALFVGMKKSEFEDRFHEFEMQQVLMLFALLVVFAMLMGLLGRVTNTFEKSKEDHFRFLQTLIDTISSPIFYKDKGGRYLGCNKAFLAYIGITREELVGKTVHELWPAELADKYRQMDQELFENGGAQTYEASVRFADGTLHDVIFNKAVFLEKDGTLGGLVGVILDISERKAAEEETNNAYQKLLEIVEFLPDATFVIDKDKRVIAWNKAIEEMTGVLKDDILGKGDHEYALPFYGERRPILIDFLDENPDVLDKYAFIKKVGNKLIAESQLPYSFHHKSKRHLWGIAARIFDKDGNHVGAIESIRDITEHKLAELDKSHLDAELHHSRMMASFMCQLGHDLQTPLTPLLTLLPLIKNKVSGGDLERMVDICCKTVDQLHGVTKKALQFVRLSATFMPDELERVTLASLVDNCCYDSKALLAEKNINCRNSIDPLIVVNALSKQLSELFSNLVGNAVRYSKENGAILIAAYSHEHVVTVSIKDEGIGLDPENLDRIFGEFFKEDVSRHDLQASGLGLSICKKIVLNHNGRIWAESPGKGQGTTIFFTLPLAISTLL